MNATTKTRTAGENVSNMLFNEGENWKGLPQIELDGHLLDYK